MIELAIVAGVSLAAGLLWLVLREPPEEDTGKLVIPRSLLHKKRRCSRCGMPLTGRAVLSHKCNP